MHHWDDAELGDQLGGATMQNWEHSGSGLAGLLGDARLHNWEANWEVGRCRIGR
jgi:hypothetical protein